MKNEWEEILDQFKQDSMETEECLRSLDEVTMAQEREALMKNSDKELICPLPDLGREIDEPDRGIKVNEIQIPLSSAREASKVEETNVEMTIKECQGKFRRRPQRRSQGQRISQSKSQRRSKRRSKRRSQGQRRRDEKYTKPGFESKTYRCDICDNGFNTLQNHNTKLHKNNLFLCPNCENSSITSIQTKEMFAWNEELQKKT